MRPVSNKAIGNAHVIKALETMLRAAKKGRAGYFAGAMITEGKAPDLAVAGNLLLERDAGEALLKVLDKIDESFSAITMPPRDESLDASFVCYNVPGLPLSYDFVQWLVAAEMTRIREKAPAPLKVAFWWGPEGKRHQLNPARAQMFAGVVKPALDLIGAVEDSRAMLGRTTSYCVVRDITEGYKSGQIVPFLNAPSEARISMGLWLRSVGHWRAPVTITLRECEGWPERNSNIAAWLAFADHLRARAETVIFVRDTAKSHEPMANHLTCPQAAIDLHARMALYQAARMNFFVSNGPVTLPVFSKAPWTMFWEMKPEGHVYPPATPSFVHEHYGIDPHMNEQFPWSGPDQRIVWSNDDYPNLVRAWAEFTANRRAA